MCKYGGERRKRMGTGIIGWIRKKEDVECDEEGGVMEGVSPREGVCGTPLRREGGMWHPSEGGGMWHPPKEGVGYVAPPCGRVYVAPPKEGGGYVAPP